MKKQVKEVKEKDIKTTVSVASIRTQIVYKNEINNAIILNASDDLDGTASKVRISTTDIHGFLEAVSFHSTDAIRRCLDHFDEMREANKKTLNTVIDFEEVEKPVEKQD